MRAVEILELEERITLLTNQIDTIDHHIEYLKGRFVDPWKTIAKYEAKRQVLLGERYELQKELVVLENAK